MPLIGFTVFKDKLLSGEKRQTIRKLRKRPFRVDDKLYLYWHLRRKDCEKIGEAICRETFFIETFSGITLCNSETFNYGCILRFENLESGRFCRDLDPNEVEDLAKRDGFSNGREMLEWLLKHYPDMNEITFQVVRW